MVDAGADAVNELAEWEFQRRFGTWSPLQPAAVGRLFAGAPFRWWVAGGWSLDDSSAPARAHDDIDVAVLDRDLRAARQWLGDWHIWEAHEGTLRPLLPGRESLAGREQWWLRRDAWSPWALDVLLTPTEGDQWLYKKDHRVRRDLDSVTTVGADGVPYQVAEITLLYKAFLDREKDRADLERAWPTLDGVARQWLRQAIEVSKPASPWLARLSR